MSKISIAGERLHQIILAPVVSEKSTRAAENSNQAVFKVLRWTDGNFEVNFEGKTTQQTTQLNTQGLLMEGLRQLDEAQRDGGGKPEEEEEDVLLDS